MKLKQTILLTGVFIFATLSAWSAGKAMWDWKYVSATEPEQRKVLLQFCKQKNIERLFLQISYAFVTTKDGQIACQLDNPEGFHSFLADAHKNGIKVDALDGASKFALKEWHPYVLSQIDAIIAFNKAAKPTEQVDGIHLDIEPYTLKDYQTGQAEAINKQFLDLVSAITQKIKASKQKLVLGLSIPFWFDEGEENGKLKYLVTWKGTTKVMSEHLQDLTDEVAIMDYRTQAQGDNGTIRHAQGEVKYAGAIGKKVWIGLETTEIHGDPPTISFFGHPEADLNKVLDETHAAYMNVKGYQGIAIHHYNSYKKMVDGSSAK